jgi:hypothetical protein
MCLRVGMERLASVPLFEKPETSTLKALHKRGQKDMLYLVRRTEVIVGHHATGFLTAPTIARASPSRFLPAHAVTHMFAANSD